ncbi:8814_t:CDS:1, partial [Entrophospora sp. SA101]
HMPEKKSPSQPSSTVSKHDGFCAKCNNSHHNFCLPQSSHSHPLNVQNHPASYANWNSCYWS